MQKAIVTCAITGVLTDPRHYPAPVTPEEMARASRQACDEGASVIHVHFRRLEPGQGHLPSWAPEVARDVIAAIRASCPDVLINQTTGIVGPDISGPVACLAAVRPEIAALNAGSLNYLKTRADGGWTWPPMLFDNRVEKISAFLEAMTASGSMRMPRSSSTSSSRKPGSNCSSSPRRWPGRRRSSTSPSDRDAPRRRSSRPPTPCSCS